MNHVANERQVACMLCIASYVRTDGWLAMIIRNWKSMPICSTDAKFLSDLS